MRRASFLFALLLALYVLYSIVIGHDEASDFQLQNREDDEQETASRKDKSTFDSTETSPSFLITAVPTTVSAGAEVTTSDPFVIQNSADPRSLVGSGQDSGAVATRAAASQRGQYGSPELDALSEAQDLSNQPGLVHGLIPGVFSEVNPSRPTARASAAPTVTSTLPRVGGQARGYAMLYLMQPGARATVEKQIVTLLRAQVDELFLGVLVDGTFSSGDRNADFDYLASVVRRLSKVNRALTLLLYITNGATMRDFATTTIEAPFSRTDPLLFRDQIANDSAVRAQFLALVRAAIPVLDLNRRLSPRNKNFVSVMLEDNLTVDSYRVMRGLARSVVGNRATFVRSPCVNCGVEGSDADSAGDGIDSHSPEQLASLSSRDGFTLDGVGYDFPGETSPALSIREIDDLAEISLSVGLRYFGLWRAARQGNRTSGDFEHPNNRTYEIPTDEQSDIEVELLRHGLFPIGDN